MKKYSSKKIRLGVLLPEWFVSTCEGCGDGYYATKGKPSIATEITLYCDQCKSILKRNLKLKGE